MPWSLPAWGVWIEIGPGHVGIVETIASLPAWGGWIEMLRESVADHVSKSLPAWGGWIEILCLVAV